MQPIAMQGTACWLQPLAKHLGDHCYCIMQADVQVRNDAVAALASGTGGQLHGIVLIAGTGKHLCCTQQDPLDLCCSAHVPLTCTVAHVAAWLDLLLGLLECRTVADSGGSHASIAICSADR